MKKILVLSASPRKGGNSDTLCEQFIKGALEVDHAIEKIYIDDYKIGHCRACDSCKFEGICIQNDEMVIILDKMIEANVIVMATPLYYQSMNGQMKTLIDRTLPLNRTELSEKDFYFIATASGKKCTMKRAIDGLRGFTNCLPKSKVKGVIYGEKAWQLGDINKSPAMQKAYNAGKNV